MRNHIYRVRYRTKSEAYSYVVISVGSNKEKEVRKEVICELEKVLGAFSSGNGLDIKYIQDTGFKANKKGIIYFDL